MGQTIGRLDHGGKCPSDREKIDGLCYKKCPPGQVHVAGMPYHCKKEGVGGVYGGGVGTIPGCPPGQKQSGALCYDDPGPGWRVVAGVAWQDCPPGSKDIGAFCIPGAGDAGSKPWYLSTYILIAACIIIAVSILYWRARKVYAMVTGSSRRMKSR